MKKIRLLLIIASAFLLAGCTGESLRENPDKDCIVLYFSGGSPITSTGTKASTNSGISSYNENLITSVDCFFYPSDKTGEDAVMSATGRTVERVEVAGSPSEILYKVTIRYTSAQAMDIFRSEEDGTAKVFVIANASLSYDGGGTSIPDLKAKIVERDFSAQMQQGSFVMFSEDDEDSSDGYTITMSEGTISGRIPMDRVAAKAQLFVKLPESLEDPNTAKLWYPQVEDMKIYLENGVKRTCINAPYVIANDGSDYFSYDARPLYNFSTASEGTAERAMYADATAALESAGSESAGSYIYSSYPFYSYPASWNDIHEHGTHFIIEIPWKLNEEGALPSVYRYQVSANNLASIFERNHFYRTFVEIETLGGVAEDRLITIPECNYIITPWFSADVGASTGYPIEGTLDTKSYLVVEPERVILNNEEEAVFTYLSSSSLSSAETKVIEVRYYNYKNSSNQIVRDTDSAISNDAKTNSTAIQVDISEPGKVKVKHKLYNNDGSQKIFVEYQIKVRIQNGDGLYEEVSITQRPPMYVLMKDGDNAFVDGYFRHVKKTGGGAPFDNAYAFTGISAWNGYYRSVSYYKSPDSNTKDSYWYLGTLARDNNSDFTNGYSVYMVVTPYGNLAGTPGNTTLNLFDITGIKLSAFSELYHSYTVGIGQNGSGAVSQQFDYRIGDPRIQNDFTGTPKLVDYLTGMGTSYTTQQTYRRRYNSNNVYTKEWGTLAEEIKIGTTDHNENTLIAPYILISSSYLGQLSLNTETNNWGVTYEQAKKRCATYQEGGYPAGRWRLPTEAEIMFIVERQRNNDINTLFNDNSTSYYWAASGYYYCNGRLYSSTNAARAGAARCVYDAWYWGDEPVAAAAYTYTPMP